MKWAVDFGRRLRRAPLSSALGVIAVVVSGVAIVVPLAVTHYPPIIDLPFHAAQTATLRHYLDPAFHFREQFDLRPLAVPYLLMYALGAALMLVLPMLTAVKVAAGCMLALLPAGLAILLRGLKKSPLLGVFGAAVAWLPLTHWGFFNFVGALGLFAMAIGFSALALERPSIGARVALALTLVALFFAHLFRFPLAIAGVLGTALILGKGPRRFVPVLAPMVPSLALFGAWLLVRPDSLRAPMDPLRADLSRLAEIPDWLSGAFRGSGERTASLSALTVVVVVAVGSVIARYAERRARPLSSSRRRFGRRARLVALGCAAVSLILFVSLPMQIGNWWYVYPREATAAVFLALAALPDLPKARRFRVPLFALATLAPLSMSRMVAKNYADFDRATADFYAITRLLPEAPKLLYLVFDHSGTTRTISPFVHLPAYVQAERGGWLSFHFANYGASPLVYRPREGRETIIPPPTPPLWEGTPERFEVLDRGRFFDWFLVRRASSPKEYFDEDPSIEEVAHVGLWWLYRRAPEAYPAPLAGR